jgi:hypothetical protein
MAACCRSSWTTERARDSIDVFSSDLWASNPWCLDRLSRPPFNIAALAAHDAIDGGAAVGFLLDYHPGAGALQLVDPAREHELAAAHPHPPPAQPLLMKPEQRVEVVVAAYDRLGPPRDLKVRQGKSVTIRCDL